MTDMDDTHSQLKSKLLQLRAELTQFHDQLQHIFAINQFQRQALCGWLQELDQDDTRLLGLSLTDQWQSGTEKRLDKMLEDLRSELKKETS